MNGKSLFFRAFCVALLAVASICFADDDPIPQRGDIQPIAADKCAEIQGQIDEIVAIGESTSLSDQEKLDQLSASWSKSLANLFKASAEDPEAVKMAQEMADSFNALLASANASASPGDKNIAPNVARDLEVMKKRTKPYIAVMKLLCPDIVMPKTVEK
jgi:hypothetical protein